MAHTTELSLELARIDDLFEGPGIDIKKHRLDTQSGIDSIMDELRAKRLPRQVRTTISLPDVESEEDATSEELRVLIGTYCRANIHRNQLQISAIRREGLLEMFPATALLFVTTILSLFITKQRPFSEETRQLIIAGLGILSWVGMWRPLGALLYDWWEPYRDNKIYRRLLEMELVVTTDD